MNVLCFKHNKNIVTSSFNSSDIWTIIKKEKSKNHTIWMNQTKLACIKTSIRGIKENENVLLKRADAVTEK